jgi:hypothetical protein
MAEETKPNISKPNPTVSKARETKTYEQEPDTVYNVSIPEVKLDPRVAMLGGAERLLFGEYGPMMSLAMQQSAQANIDMQRLKLGMPKVVAGANKEVGRTIEYEIPENENKRDEDIYDTSTLGVIKYYDGQQEVPVIKYGRRKDNGLYDYIFSNSSIVMDKGMYDEALMASLDGYNDEKIRMEKMNDLMKELSESIQITNKGDKIIVNTLAGTRNNFSREARIFINSLFKYGIIGEPKKDDNNGQNNKNDDLIDPNKKDENKNKNGNNNNNNNNKNKNKKWQ